MLKKKKKKKSFQGKCVYTNYSFDFVDCVFTIHCSLDLHLFDYDICICLLHSTVGHTDPVKHAVSFYPEVALMVEVK